VEIYNQAMDLSWFSSNNYQLFATALNLSLSALGNIRTESLRAFSSTDMLKIVAKML
jgi:uncharacterized protein with GYD domain